MAQPVYPTLSDNPDEESFVREYATDPTKRTKLEGGAYVVMRRLTTVPLRWSFVYRDLSVADRNALLTFYTGDANCGAVVIKWTDPSDSVEYFVRFMGPPQCTLEPTGQNTWRVAVEFIQAIGTYT